jgi:hypothetical protein
MDIVMFLSIYVPLYFSNSVAHVTPGSFRGLRLSSLPLLRYIDSSFITALLYNHDIHIMLTFTALYSFPFASHCHVSFHTKLSTLNYFRLTQ